MSSRQKSSKTHRGSLGLNGTKSMLSKCRKYIPPSLNGSAHGAAVNRPERGPTVSTGRDPMRLPINQLINEEMPSRGAPMVRTQWLLMISDQSWVFIRTNGRQLELWVPKLQCCASFLARISWVKTNALKTRCTAYCLYALEAHLVLCVVWV